MKNLLFVILFLPTLSHAGNIYCKGKIKNVYVEENGNVNIMGAWREHWTRLCNTNDDTVVCSLWASYAANAVKDNLNVTIMYNANNGVTCNTLPTYADSPPPRYFMVHNPAI
ncbi:hypothetical protein [Vibrio campbellii]|uniref:hypothetical protein n=1 Tax=Vibrio campbellii TaxID=680 RepID=UPI003301F678|nr:hypothetical protein [Vibrio campbellii]HDM8225502.1 hypothetical protein [Vibrio campbellii]HDM8226006.1 hypothetical protein [Vibrio campbellii]HDM8243039.1 hypothetical protein [Vibrio campbellii]HDM8245884.1 hypothetical protein [Vibrio campbellii]